VWAPAEEPAVVSAARHGAYSQKPVMVRGRELAERPVFLEGDFRRSARQVVELLGCPVWLSPAGRRTGASRHRGPRSRRPLARDADHDRADARAVRTRERHGCVVRRGCRRTRSWLRHCSHQTNVGEQAAGRHERPQALRTVALRPRTRQLEGAPVLRQWWSAGGATLCQSDSVVISSPRSFSILTAASWPSPAPDGSMNPASHGIVDVRPVASAA
jgi:hypothetical protein